MPVAAFFVILDHTLRTVPDCPATSRVTVALPVPETGVIAVTSTGTPSELPDIGTTIQSFAEVEPKFQMQHRLLRY